MYEDTKPALTLNDVSDLNETPECKIDLMEFQISYIKQEIPYKADINEMVIKRSSYIDGKDVQKTKQQHMKDKTLDVGIVFHSSDSEDFDCDECDENYRGYCLTCTPVSHFLNNISLENVDLSTTSNDIVKIKDASEGNSVIALKTIKRNIIFGPFEGVSAIKTDNGYMWRIKNKKLIDIENGNWMQYVNCADNATDNNIEVMQFNGNLYFQTKRQINEGEELLVYYQDKEIKKSDDSEVSYFIPMKQNKSREIYACTLCYVGFSLDEHLIKHKRKCLNLISDCSELIQCCQCDIWLEKQEYLKYHASSCEESNSRTRGFPAILDLTKVKTPTEGEEIVECDTHNDDVANNGHTIGNKKGLRNANACKAEDFKCSHCSFKTNRQYFLKVHIKKKHPVEGGEDFKCSHCSFQTNRRGSLKTHVTRRHTAGEVKDFKCVQCLFETNSRHYLKEHIKNKHAVGGEKELKCSQCDYETNRQQSLKVHIKNHHIVGDRKDFQCDQCFFDTNSKYYLKMHIKNKHRVQNGKDFKCLYCSFETNNRQYFKIHTKNKHVVGDRKDFQCDHCSFKTNNKQYLKIHTKNKHQVENVKDFKCSYCTYETNHKNSLKIHIKCRHSDGIEKDFKCAQCTFETNIRQHLKLHIGRKHPVGDAKNFKCTQCSYETNQRSYLTTHIRIKHSVGKKKGHKCSQCSFATKHKPRLQQHIKKKHS